MLELTNTIPDGTKFQATIFRYSPPTARTSGSLLNRPTSHWGTRWQITNRITIAAVAIVTPTRNVARTRSGRRAPKFCPATGLQANPSATTGMKPAWITRRPMPNPACGPPPNAAAAPRLRRRAEPPGDRVDDEHVDAHQRELRARRQPDRQHASPHRE